MNLVALIALPLTKPCDAEVTTIGREAVMAVGVF